MSEVKLKMKLCINFLMSCSKFKTFVNTNNLIFEIGKHNAHEKDIGKLVFTIFEEFKLQLPNDLQNQMESMFEMKMIKTIKVSHQYKLFTKKKADDITMCPPRRSYWMQLKIRNKNNRQLGTIENVFTKALETNTEKEKDKKYQQELRKCRMSY